MTFTKIEIQPTSIRDDGKVFFDIDRLDLPESFKAKEKWLASIPAGTFGGNHKHSRTEIFLAIGEGMTFVWKDKDDNINEENMNPEKKYFLFIVHPWLPHAVINNGNSPGTLIEFADGPLNDAKIINLI